MKIFAERLNLLRLERGLSAEELGGILGVPEKTILKWEEDRGQSPRYEKLVEICKFFAVSSDYLFGCDKQKSRP